MPSHRVLGCVISFLQVIEQSIGYATALGDDFYPLKQLVTLLEVVLKHGLKKGLVQVGAPGRLHGRWQGQTRCGAPARTLRAMRI